MSTACGVLEQLLKCGCEQSMLLITPMKTVHTPWDAVVKQQQQKRASVAEGVEHPGPSCPAGGEGQGCSHHGEPLGVSAPSSTGLPCAPAPHFQVRVSKRDENGLKPVFTAAPLTLAHRCRPPTGPRRDEWIHLLWSIHKTCQVKGASPQRPHIIPFI